MGMTVEKLLSRIGDGNDWTEQELCEISALQMTICSSEKSHPNSEQVAQKIATLGSNAELPTNERQLGMLVYNLMLFALGVVRYLDGGKNDKGI